MQELLFMLCGYSGDIFVENEAGNFKIIDTLPFISPTEQNLLNEICILGSYYKKINDFTEQYNLPLINSQVTGLYKLAFATATRDMLKEYRRQICDIERELLSNEYLTISYIRGRLNDYYILFPSIYSVTSQIEKCDFQGCKIIDVIFKTAYPMGNEWLKNIWNKIIGKCNQIMILQISEWILKGRLRDNYNEFFIKSECKDDKIEFSINIEKLPCIIPISLAKKIKQIGESIHLFSKRKRIDNKFEEKFSKLFKELQKENDQNFNVLQLQSAVELVDKDVRQQMWQLVIKDNQFFSSCFNNISDYMLLGRGEIIQYFINEIEAGGSSIFTKNDDSNISLGLQNAWKRALRFVLPEEETESVCENHKMQLRSRSWAGILQTVNVNWPHSLVIGREAQLVYEALFSMLLRLRRTQSRISRLHYTQRRNTNKNAHCLLQQKMKFVIGCIHSYLSLDVVESLLVAFREEALSVEDIEHLQASHSKFISDLHSQTFLSSSQVRSSLMSLCDTCIELCNAIEMSDANIMDSNNVRQRIGQLSQKFVTQSVLLYNVLSNIESSNVSGSPFLRQLIARLDFNGHFSKMGSEFGSLMRTKSDKPIPTFHV